MQALMVFWRASDLMFHCHLSFILKVSQTHVDMYKPYWIGYCNPHGKLTWNDYDDDDDYDDDYDYDEDFDDVSFARLNPPELSSLFALRYQPNKHNLSHVLRKRLQAVSKSWIE